MRVPISDIFRAGQGWRSSLTLYFSLAAFSGESRPAFKYTSNWFVSGKLFALLNRLPSESYICRMHYKLWQLPSFRDGDSILIYQSHFANDKLWPGESLILLIHPGHTHQAWASTFSHMFRTLTGLCFRYHIFSLSDPIVRFCPARRCRTFTFRRIRSVRFRPRTCPAFHYLHQ